MAETAHASLPEGLLLAYYGDDFTGSTDAMEAMTAAGIPTILFLDSPTPEALARYMRAENEKWGKVVRDTGATIN